MAKAAFTVWENRIAPVFDVARHVRLVETENGRIVREDRAELTEESPVQKARRIADLGCGILVCGAISRPVQEMASAFGIRVISFMSGDEAEVLQAWLEGRLDEERFAMPGCRRRARGGRGGRPGRGSNCGGRGRGRCGPDGRAATGPAGRGAGKNFKPR
ncbi:NifB/NifX family molybdenum-iron cluster-binding protein [bacterium]|nr:NifB/NifX family molybdenum-iron cluster-binding protein [bacterium]